MNSNLTPTQITDVNGRVTIVHKRVQVTPPATSRLASIAPPVARSQQHVFPGSTPLPAVELIAVEEFQDWGQNYPDLTKRAAPADYTRLEALINYAPPETWALTKRIVDSGVDVVIPTHFIENFVKQIETRWRGAGGAERSGIHLEASLLVTEHVDFSLASQQLSRSAMGVQLSGAVEGYKYSENANQRCPLERLETYEEVASMAAVATFIISSNGTNTYGRRYYLDDSKMDINGTIITNRALDQFLRDNPHELQRVIKFSRDNIEHNKLRTKKDVKTMIQFLRETEDVPVLSDGWL